MEADSLTQPGREMRYYSKALNELCKAVISHSDNFASSCYLSGSDEDLSGNSTAGAFHDSQVLFTETDVTLPSCLDGSPESQKTEKDGKLQGSRQLPEPCRSSSLVLAEVYQEMMTIYGQLKAERHSQQQWEKSLQERERRLRQQEEAVRRWAELEEKLHTRLVAVEEKHKQEISQLQDIIRERSKENKRLKSSFDTIKELNDNMKKQLNETVELNKRLENQSKRVQARLDNLQRKHEHSVASRGCQKMTQKNTECIKPSQKERPTASAKHSNKGSSSPTSPKLLVLLLDWVLLGPTFSSVAGNKVKGVDQCLPPEVHLSERCLKVLPMLASQLHHTPPTEPDLLLNLLRLIQWALSHMDSNTPHVPLSATLRRIGEEVLKRCTQITVPQAEDPDLYMSCRVVAPAPGQTLPLSCSPCSHTRILSTLIILRTLTQADVLAQTLDSLNTELMSEESRGLFIHYGGVSVLLSMFRAGHGGLLSTVNILIQLTEQSRHLNSFLEACSCEEFFLTVSKLLRNHRLELPSLEKLSILLQKLSSIRKNRRLFELSSLHHQLQELSRTNHTHTFLCLNIRSILHNLK